MREKSKSFRREELELLSSAELNQMVRSELDKDSIDRDAVLQILRILEDRDAKDTTLQKVDDTAAWEEFQAHFVAAENSHVKSGNAHTRKKSIPWFAKTVVAAIIVFALLVVAPPALGYDSVFELVAIWTQDVFQLINPNSAKGHNEYKFKTDHPGLQQVYDAVTELGITQPVVPTWLPDGYDLKELKPLFSPKGNLLTSVFMCNNLAIRFLIKPYEQVPSYKYEKDDTDIFEYGISGVTHYIAHNDGKWVAVWVIDRFEMSISTNQSEEVLYKLIDSVYMEVEE